jgi:YidC/Oxa1 family membrane protein insertase
MSAGFSMDKKTLLALILSFLVFLVWSLLFGPKPTDKPSPKPPVAEEPQEQQVAPAKREPLGPQKELTLGTASEAPDIKVETELYSALFSGSGPMIKGFTLKNYRSTAEKDSPLKELIHVSNKDGHGFDLAFHGQNIPNIAWSAFTTDKKGIEIQKGEQPEELVYTWRSPQGVDIQTRFLFHAETYAIDLAITVDNGSGQVVDDAPSLRLTHLPLEAKKAYGAFEGMALLLGNKLEEIKVSKIKEKRFEGRIRWVAYEQPYFMAAIASESDTTLTAKGATLPNGEIRVSYITPSLNVKPLERITKNFTLYLGPRDLYVLKGLGKKLEKAINFGWFDIIAKPLLVTLRFFNKYVSNYGLSIMLLTVLIKILFWPLTHKSYKSMKEMRKLQPMMAKIREKYKNNKQEMQKQLMSLYKTYKINPMGGCLPMVVQIPVFFAFYRILPSSIELRHAPFVLWINDLSAPERLLSFSFKIPFMAPPYGIPVMTLLMGASMFLQQKMTPSPGDPAQAKMMMLLPIVFTVFFINFPAGLVLYWLVNNLLSIAQQYRINKQAG